VARRWCLLLVLAIGSAVTADILVKRVGPVGGGATRVPTGQVVRPEGQTVVFSGRPVDLALAADGSRVYLKDNRGLVVVDGSTWRVRQELRFPSGGGSMHGIAASPDGRRVYLTTAQDALYEAVIAPDGSAAWRRAIRLPGPQGRGDSHACGIALSSDGRTAYVCLSRNNSVGVVDLDQGALVREIPVGVAPYGIALLRDGRTSLVSNWGGRRPGPRDRAAPSSGTPVVVDARGVGASGTVGFVDLERGVMEREVAVGLHPSDLLVDEAGGRAFVANAHSDTVSVLSLGGRRVIATLSARLPGTRLPGATPNALAWVPARRRLYVALALENVVLEMEPTAPSGRVTGVLQTGWYPAALAAKGAWLFVANAKGTGSRAAGDAARSRHVHEHSGSAARIALVSGEGGRRPARAIAGRHGQQPAGIQHVVYIIKENRTYDQVFGDLPQGDGDPSLCLFGREVTPNHHALAEEFALLDNYYCNGICSADGHSWATEGNSGDHLEKAAGGYTRSYTFGDDPLTYSPTGFVWDAARAKGLSFRNYGEMDYAEAVPQARFAEVLADWRSGARRIRFTQRIGIDRLRRMSCRAYPGWNMQIPDAVRADVFLRELAAFERRGAFPNLTIIYLPNDHTEGTNPGSPTPRAYMADNDLALGRIVEGLSRSRFWPRMVIFVNEDDPQAGVDHVDGHRSLCLVVSPATRGRGVVSAFYNQSSVLHTIGRLLGFPPPHRAIAMAPTMEACFRATPDMRPYACRPVSVSLDERNPPSAALRGEARRLAAGCAATDFGGPDRIDEDLLNRAVWASRRRESYPAHLAGAHGRGLPERRLAHVPSR